MLGSPYTYALSNSELCPYKGVIRWLDVLHSFTAVFIYTVKLISLNIFFVNSYPDATDEELSQLDNVCIICRDEMTSGKKLPCNHIFHAHCLRSWFQRQQSCPTCRMDVLRPTEQQQQQQQRRQAQAQAHPPQQQPQQPPGFPPQGKDIL